MTDLSTPQYTFSPDAVIRHHDYELRIQKRLSSGLTGEVYRGILLTDTGQIDVAVKVMRSLEFAQAYKFFQGEGITLGRLMDEERKWNELEEQTPPVKVAPIYYGMSEHDGHPYLVMEFITGQPIPKLLEQRGKLSEAQAARIAWQFYHLLDLLHQKLRQTYLDLKFDNLWWVENGNTGYLKVTDLGTMDDISNKDDAARLRSVQRDLLLSAVYLCAMLTGHILHYSYGELREQAAPTLNKASLSWGMRQLLRALLHPNSNARPKAAMEVVGRLKWLVDCWEKDATALIGIARNNLSRATETAIESDRDRFANQARVALGVLEQKLQDGLSPETRAMIEQVDDILKKGDYLQRGRALIEGRSYPQAREVFEKGFDWSDDPAILRRWATLAQIAEASSSEKFDASRDEFIAILSLMQSGDFSAAQKRLNELTQFSGDKGYRSLVAECEIQLALDHASEYRARSDYQNAAAAYRKAINLQAQMLYQEQFLSNEIGDLRPLAEEMERQQTAEGESIRLMQSAKEKFLTGGEAFEDVEIAYSRALGNQKFITALVESIKTMIAQARFGVALRLSEIGLRDFPPNTELATARALALGFWQVKQAVLIRDYHAAFQYIKEIWNNPDCRVDEATRPAIEHLIARLEDETRKTQSFICARTAADIAGLLDETERADGLKNAAAEYTQTYETSARKLVDQQIAWATQLLYLDDPQGIAHRLSESGLAVSFSTVQQRLKEANAWIVDSKNIAGPIQYRVDEIEQLERIVKEIQAQHEDSPKLAEQRMLLTKELLNQIETEWGRVQSLEKEYDELSRLGADVAVRQVVGAQRAKDLGALLQLCYRYLSEYTEDSEKVNQIIGQVMLRIHKSGSQSLLDLQKQIEEHLSIINQRLVNAKKALKTGQLDEARSQLAQLETEYGLSPDWQELHNQLIQIDAWRKWLADHAIELEKGEPNTAITNTLSKYRISSVPPVYLGDSRVINYLQKAINLIEQQISQNPSRLEVGSINLLRLLVDIKDLLNFYKQSVGNFGGQA